MTPSTIHVACTSQVHTCSNISDSQINSVSESLTASANYLRKLVEGQRSTASNPKSDPQANTSVKGETTTVSVHADATYESVLKGFTLYDSKDVDTAAYLVKRQAYDEVRKRYPQKIDDLTRDQKVKALTELKRVGFRYYSIKVVAFVEIDGLTRMVSSKSHHRLERPAKDYLERILTDTFQGLLRGGDSSPQPWATQGGPWIKIQGPPSNQVPDLHE